MHGGVDKGREVFREEAAELLAELESSLLELEDDPGNMELVGRVFRAMHTLKGSGAMFGMNDVASFTHDIETVFDRVRSGEISLTKDMVDLTLRSLDRIAAMLKASLKGGPAVSSQAEELISSFHKILSDADGAESEHRAEASGEEGLGEGQPEGLKTYRIRFTPGPDILSRGINPLYMLDELRGLGECIVTADMGRVPLLDDIDPESCYTSWEALLTTDRGIEAVRDVFIFVEGDCEVSVEPVDAETGLTTHEGPGAQPDTMARRGAPPTDAAPAKNNDNGPLPSLSIRVASEKLDVLADLVGELVTAQARLSRTVASSRDTELLRVSEEVERLIEDLRDNTLSMRMVPIGTTFVRFKRLVRDLSRELGKEVVILTQGGDTELDKSVIEKLNDPIVHLIRNSIDHGIEPPERRESTGKPRHGSLKLSADHSGGYVLISITDDGAGIDADAVRLKAQEAGLIAQDNQLTDREAFSLVFAPGFTTAGEVTGVSGRGVGMDVVKRRVDSLRGGVEISSAKGEGTTVTLRIPLTLAIIDGLLVSVRDSHFVIPLTAVEECVELDRAKDKTRPGRNLVEVRGELVPFIALGEQFGLSGEAPGLEQVVVIEEDGRRVGFAVDRVIGEHQTVIKSLGRFYKDMEGISGATILGDGKVALILDVPKLVRYAQNEEARLVKEACA